MRDHGVSSMYRGSFLILLLLLPPSPLGWHGGPPLGSAPPLPHAPHGLHLPPHPPSPPPPRSLHLVGLVTGEIHVRRRRAAPRVPLRRTHSPPTAPRIPPEANPHRDPVSEPVANHDQVMVMVVVRRKTKWPCARTSTVRLAPTASASPHVAPTFPGLHDLYYSSLRRVLRATRHESLP